MLGLSVNSELFFRYRLILCIINEIFVQRVVPKKIELSVVARGTPLGSVTKRLTLASTEDQGYTIQIYTPVSIAV